MTTLLSYPRSGNTWLRYCIEFLSKRPTAIPGSKNAGGNPVAEVIPNMGVDLTAPPICGKSHNIDFSNKHKVIVLVRDYKEAIVRHYNMLKLDDLRKKFVSETTGKSRKGVDYIKILQFFDEAENKILVYYEDLILQPRKNIVRVIDFLNVGHEHVDEFFNNYDFHHAQGLRSYHGGSHTKGARSKLKAHQDALPKSVLKEMTNSIKSRHKDIFNKYLKRYDYE